ncbi:peptidoglycan-binding protein [Phaeobacter sp.]|uniref:peptidoglycan-binding protein n=1 Tax=Phaeobacter sp. TaxID=1902409 RepID=UPI0025F6EDA4|nr:peptidoglycan-binding protein [Phaeobacter sp.]
MLTANRFTTVPTYASAKRLEQAAANLAPISRRERDKGAVVAIQTALAALNNGYMAGAEIDGAFGRRTEAAVEAFQRDYGLVADGVVGRQVLLQLEEIFAGEASRPPHGVSLHVGVDNVDPNHYGAPLTLPSCINDAREMERIAQSLGYDTARLEDQDATTANVAGFLRNAARTLFAGDAVFVTYSGYGSQVTNLSVDEETDGRDETLCLYDRMLIDDELYALLSEFREGVRVHLVFDSCHSGTAFKMIAVNPLELADAERSAHRNNIVGLMTSVPPVIAPDLSPDDAVAAITPIAPQALAGALDGELPELDPVRRPSAAVAEQTAEMFADLLDHGTNGGPKFVDGAQFYEKNQPLYDSVRTAVGNREREELACTLTAFSAAMDHQTTPAGNPLSLFTFNISQTWNNGGFNGSYAQFHRAVLKRSRPDATPQLAAEGSMGATARLQERPFSL